MHIAKLKRPLLIIVALLLLVSIPITIWLNLNNSSSAADARNFNAGNIMSDFVMTNKSSMSEAQIQAFLTSKNSCNDRNIGKAAQYPNLQYNIQNGKFVCLAEESFNGESAAHIIWQAAQDYNINPQVLIVLLEKEQGLITDTWPNNVQYRSATGYGCPDTAACADKYYGFRNQVRNAANFFRAYQTGNTGWWKTVWPGNSYTGTWQPFNYNLQYHPNTSCGAVSTYIENRATASLYSYTPYRPNQASLNAQTGAGDSCSSYGNRNFWMFFSNWFGSTISSTAEKCDSKINNITCVWSARKSDGSQFLTSSKAELESAVNNYKWLYEGVAFYASKTESTGSVPVRRLQHNNRHYYSADQSEYDTMKNSGIWNDEGIVFYTPPSTTLNNTAHKVHKLYNPSKDYHYLTSDDRLRDDLLKNGYVSETNSFNSFSEIVSIPNTPPDRNNIYQLKSSFNYFYTTSLPELESAIKMGYQYDRVLTTTNMSGTGTPVYRLQHNGRHFYTSSVSERDIATSRYAYIYEGIGFYIDDSSSKIFRLTNTNNNKYLYTSDIKEVMSLTNTNSWKYEGTLVNNTDNSDSPSPVYRFLNLYNNRHFYTIDINEATRITNKGWEYETVSFYANKKSGIPIHRLLLKDKHFYTSNANERDISMSRHGYEYEGVVFYASPSPTDKPVYRLQGGNDEYFYTASGAERDSAIKIHGYKYEGIGFYLP